MKKTAKKALLLIIVLYFFIAYTDFKKGFIEGFLQKSEKPEKRTADAVDSERYDSFYFPGIIKIYKP